MWIIALWPVFEPDKGAVGHDLFHRTGHNFPGSEGGGFCFSFFCHAVFYPPRVLDKDVWSWKKRNAVVLNVSVETTPAGLAVLLYFRPSPLKSPSLPKQPDKEETPGSKSATVGIIPNKKRSFLFVQNTFCHSVLDDRVEKSEGDFPFPGRNFSPCVEKPGLPLLGKVHNKPKPFSCRGRSQGVHFPGSLSCRFLPFPAVHGRRQDGEGHFFRSGLLCRFRQGKRASRYSRSHGRPVQGRPQDSPGRPERADNRLPFQEPRLYDVFSRAAGTVRRPSREKAWRYSPGAGQDPLFSSPRALMAFPILEKGSSRSMVAAASTRMEAVDRASSSLFFSPGREKRSGALTPSAWRI
jgi:hypothetical protein